MHEIEHTCCFSGHRDIPHERYSELSGKVLSAVTELYKKGYRHFIAGGAVGFDMIAAVTVLNFRLTHSDVTLELALPCPEHNLKWSRSDKALFDTVQKRADKVTTVSPVYDKGCMFQRNRYMVDNSSALIYYCKRSRGGTKFTLDYAEKTKRLLISI